MNGYARLAIRSVVAGLIAGLVVGVLLAITSAAIPAVHLPAALIGFWVGVAVALLTFLSGWDSGIRPGA